MTKFVTKQSTHHPSFFIEQRIPPAPMKVSAQSMFMDDLGNLVPADYYKLAIALNS